MFIREMSLAEFKEFANTHFIGNFHESINYALIKAEEGFEYEFIAYGADDIVGAALILYKKIGSVYFGYSPRGFLIDYSNDYLLEDFTNKIKEYYKNRNFAFIKINPEIAIAKLNKDTMNFEYNENYKIIDMLTKNGYKKLKNNMNFEALLPRVNAIIKLDGYDYNNLSKNTRNKVKKGIRKGLILEKANPDKLNIFYKFIKNKINRDEYYYNDFYNVFSKTLDVDLMLVKVDYKAFLINAQEAYNEELRRNASFNNKLITNNNANAINAKMNSDKALLSYKNDIAEASKNLNTGLETYVAGALVIKHQNRVIIQISGFNKAMSRFSPNYFLYYALIKYYQQEYKYLDLNGITADLSKENHYYGLNRFKMGFNPDVYEYIGEFDLVIDEKQYEKLLKSGLLAKEFNK
ncbi:MAG: peptidoglycan bridge formation glycyltransferase FemA/FemB family protein [Firmicutes bacterium]|jgi:lipid II:glycine glycyltransferase (peptidoglycan interpeptide bridge formation enzyme)|nr:peptidoglycan bridge formation glycyltransferase FemA/FemB family protein [Bacillota bacterium]